MRKSSQDTTEGGPGCPPHGQVGGKRVDWPHGTPSASWRRAGTGRRKPSSKLRPGPEEPPLLTGARGLKAPGASLPGTIGMRRLLLGFLPLLPAWLPARYLVQDASSRTFGHPLPDLPEEALETFHLGDQAFHQVCVRKDGPGPWTGNPPTPSSASSSRTMPSPATPWKAGWSSTGRKWRAAVVVSRILCTPPPKPGGI